MDRNKSKNRKAGTILIAAGTAFLLLALLFIFYNEISSIRAAKASEEVVRRFHTEELSPAPSASLYKQLSMMAKIIDGEEYIGIISIPAYNIILPVNAKCDLERLKNSPCYFFGNYKEDDMVICAHNYSSHFGRLLDIAPGEEILFISADGLIYRYYVTVTENIQPTDVQHMVQNGNDNSDWDLTLFTCNWGGKTRHAVRCNRA